MRAALNAHVIDVLTPSIDLQQFAHHSNYVRSLAFVGERCAHSQCVPMQQTATNRRWIQQTTLSHSGHVAANTTTKSIIDEP